MLKRIFAGFLAGMVIITLASCDPKKEGRIDPSGSPAPLPIAPAALMERVKAIQNTVMLQQFVTDFLLVLRSTTPGLADADKTFVAAQVTNIVVCNKGMLSGDRPYLEMVGDSETIATDDRYTDAALPLAYCAHQVPRTILFDPEAALRAQQSGWAQIVRSVAFAFAGYLYGTAGGSGSLQEAPDAMRACAEGRVMYGLRVAGYVRDPLDLFASPWAMPAERRAAFDAVAASGRC